MYMYVCVYIYIYIDIDINIYLDFFDARLAGQLDLQGPALGGRAGSMIISSNLHIYIYIYIYYS